MSITKFFEVRDIATTMPVMVTKLQPINSDEDWLIKKGLGSSPYPLFLMTQLARGVSNFDPYNWIGERTTKLAHDFIEKHFDNLTTGSVIDIQYILGEKDITKKSQNPEKI